MIQCKYKQHRQLLLPSKDVPLKIAAATKEENEMILAVRKFLGAYEQSEVMIRAGLYSEGNDLVLDQAVKIWPELDSFFGRDETDGTQGSFNRLALLLRRAGGGR